MRRDSDSDILYMEIPEDENGMKYELIDRYTHYSRLFNRSKTIPRGRKSDGATWARDLGAGEDHLPLLVRFFNYWYRGRRKNRTAAWWVHDEFCINPYWDDGTPVTNLIASMVLSGILHSDGYWLEAYTWFFATLFRGGEHIVKTNGRIWFKKGVNDG